MMDQKIAIGETTTEEHENALEALKILFSEEFLGSHVFYDKKGNGVLYEDGSFKPIFE